MTIIAILIAFALCHFVRELGRCRNSAWLGKWVKFANDAFSGLPSWSGVTGFIVLMALPLFGLLLLNEVFTSLLGSTGWFLLALAVLVYSFGPRDLDTDIAEVVAAEEPERTEKLAELTGQTMPEDADACRAVAVESVFQQALRRWFGVIFWFAVLGIVGAFLYRMIDWLVHDELGLTEEQHGLFLHMQQIMDWPAAQLMTLALAISTDFDSVLKAWKQYHDKQGHVLFEGANGFLLAAARSVVLTGHAARDGYADQLEGPLVSLQQAMDLVWRMLGVWMTALALLLLIGVIV